MKKITADEGTIVEMKTGNAELLHDRSMETLTFLECLVFNYVDFIT